MGFQLLFKNKDFKECKAKNIKVLLKASQIFLVEDIFVNVLKIEKAMSASAGDLLEKFTVNTQLFTTISLFHSIANN